MNRKKLILTICVGTLLALLPLTAEAFFGCFNCEGGGTFEYCLWVGNNEDGEGIYCEDESEGGLFSVCFVSGGPCFNVEVEG